MAQVSKATFTYICPDCKKTVDFRESFHEERLDGTDTDQISIICPYCDSEEVSYFSNQRIRNNVRKLRIIRDSDDPDKLRKYAKLKRKHQKYFDKFNGQMKREYA